MGLMKVRRKNWKADLAMFLALVMLFSPVLMGLESAWLGVVSKAAAQSPQPAPSTVQPILVVPLTAAEEVPTNIAGRMTYALVSELTASKRYAPTRLSIDDPIVKRLISENLLLEDAVTVVLEQPTPEGIAEIATTMKIPAAVYGTVDSYTYDPSNGGSVKVRVTVNFLTIDLETASVVEEKTVEITEEGSSAPKLKPTPEDTLAAEAIYDAARKIVAKLIGLPPKPPVEIIKRPVGVSPLAFLIGALVVAAALSGARGKAGPVPLGPADAPRGVTAVPRGDVITISWQPPSTGVPQGYYVYRQTVDPVSFQPIGGMERIAQVQTTAYDDNTARRGQAYIYAVSAFFPDGRESQRIGANLGIGADPTKPAPVGLGIPLPPTNLRAEPRDAAVFLTWSDINPTGLVVGYRIYRNGVEIAGETTIRTTSYLDRALQNNVTYQYFVRAVSSFGLLSAPSATVVATPGNLPPQAPLNLMARFDTTAKTVTLTWSAPPDPDIAYYEVARIVVQETRAGRSLIERAGRLVPTPSTSPTIIRRLETSSRLRQQAGSEFDNAVIAYNVTVTTYIDSVAQFMPLPVNNLTGYKRLRYAVRAVDQSGQKGAWSNIAEIVPNTPPPLLTVAPRVIPKNGQVIVDLQQLLARAESDPEWQIDKLGVRIFRATTKGGTSATTLRPIHPQDVLALRDLVNGQYTDSAVTNGARYYYAVELVDKMGVPGGRSPEAVATPFATATISILPQGNRRELSGNGQDSVQLTISVLDSASRPVAGLPLRLELQGVGSLTVNPIYDDPYSDDPLDVITDEAGQVIATYRSGQVASDTTVTITATPSPLVSGVSPSQITLTLRAPVVASVEIQPQQTQLVADGQSFTRVTITVRDRLGSPMPDQTINLSLSPAQGRFEDLQGNLITQVSSGTTGIVDVIYRSGTKAGAVTLTASVGAISGQAVVTLVSGSPATIELVANPTTAPADGTTEIRVTATVKDAHGNAVPNVQVQFTSTPTLSITPAVVTTNETGQATVSVIAPRVAGSYLLRAQVRTISATLTLVFGASSPTTMTLSASRTSLVVSLPPRPEYANLAIFSRTEIAATVVDENNNPVSGVVVQFSATAGTIQPTAITDASGTARAIYLAPPSPTGQVTITAQAGAASGSMTLDILPGPPAQITVTASPLVVPADGRSQINVIARVRDANGNSVADGTIVYFSARNEANINQVEPRAGSFLRDNVPTLNGEAQVSFVAGTQPGVRARLVAQALGTIFGQNFGPIPAETDLPNLAAQFPLIQLGGQIVVALSATEMSVSSSDGTNNPADRRPLRISEPNDNFVTLRVQIVDGQGNPAPVSTPVYLTASDNRVLFVHTSRDLGFTVLTTDNNGRGTVEVYASKTAGVVTITAELRDAQNRPFVSSSVTIRQRPGVPAVVVMPTPQPNIIFVPGIRPPTSTTIVARVFDAANNPVEDGALVSFTADAGTITPSNTTTVGGVASTTLTSTPDTGHFDIKATAWVPGQQTPAMGSTTVAFAVDVAGVNMTADPTSITGDGQSTSRVTANFFIGSIPDGTRVLFTTDRGFVGTGQQRSVRVPVAGNTAQVTFQSEYVSADTIATVRVEVVDGQGNIVRGNAQITMIRPPQLPVLQALQVTTTTLSVSSSNSTNPAQRQPLGPEPNKTTVTVTVLEQNVNLPVPNATVFLSSSDANGLWEDSQGNTRLGGIQVVTDENGRAVATFYASMTSGQVTLTARMDQQEQTATITVMPGNPASVVVTFSGTRTAPDGVPYIYVPGAGIPTSATVIATVKDANGNNVRDNTSVRFSVLEGSFSPTDTIATQNGQAQVTLSSSQATGEFVVQATAGSAVGTSRIRYAANVPDITSITANPDTIPDDGVAKSNITIQLPAPDGTRFQVVTDLGVLKFDTQTGSAIAVTVTGGQAVVELRGPGNITTRRVATITAEVVALDGTKKSKSTQVTLLPRVEITVDGAPIAPFSLVVSSNNSLDPAARLPLNGVPGSNKKRIQIIIRGSMPPDPTVTLLASEGNVLFDVIEGSNAGDKRLATVSGNLQQFGQGPTQENRYTVDMYSSTLAGNFDLQINVPGVGVSEPPVRFTQLAGPPGAIVVSAGNDRIGVQGHPTMPTLTTILVNVRDAVGNPVERETVFFSADEGRLERITSPTDSNGVATTTLTSTNSTRRVRVFAKAIGLGGQEVVGFTIVSFVVGNLASIDLIPDRTDIPPNETATTTVIFNPAREMPDNVRFGAELIGAYGVLESISTTLGGRATIRIRNNNPTNTLQTARLAVRVIRQDGLEMTKSLDFNLLPSQVLAPVELRTNRPQIVVSNNDATTNPAHRQSLGTNPNNATLTLIVRDLNAGEQVSVTLESTDPKGLFVPPVGLAQNSMGSLSFNITDNGTGDGDSTAGTISVTVNYYSSRKAQPVTIRAKVNRGATFYGESAVSIFQVPGPVEKAFFTVDPLRIAVNTVTGEPTQARLIASVYDANDNPVPNERVSFAIFPTQVVPYSDVLTGDAQHLSLTRYDLRSFSQYFNAQGSGIPAQNAWGPGGVPKSNFYIGYLQFVPGFAFPPLTQNPGQPPVIADGGIQQSEVFTDANGIATTLLTSVNVCQPVTVRMVPQSNTNLERTFTTLYYVPVDGAPQVVIEQGGLVNGPGATFTVAFRFSPASALPVGTRVWVRIHGTAYDGDEDGDGLVNEDPPGRVNWDDDKDGRIDEDPAGDANGDNNNDDDFDGRTDEDPYGPNNADDDGDGRVDEDWNPQLVDGWQTVTVTEPGVIRVSITNSSSGPDWANGWKVVQVFVWNRDGIRLMGQTSPIEFR